MDVAFSVGLRGLYGKCECFVMQMLYVCVLCASCDSPLGSWKKRARRDPCKTTRPIHLVKLFTNSSNTSKL